VVLENLLQFGKLRGRQQAGERQSTAPGSDGDLNGLQCTTSTDGWTLVHKGAAFNGQSFSKACIAEVEMPASNLQIETVTNGRSQVFQIGSIQGHGESASFNKVF
jgi:hypothetical protein